MFPGGESIVRVRTKAVGRRGRALTEPFAAKLPANGRDAKAAGRDGVRDLT